MKKNGGGVKRIQTVFFDLDGTLIDTEPSAVHVVRECFHEWGIPATLEDSSFVTGRTWQMALEIFYKKYKFPIPYDEAMKIMLERYRKTLKAKLTPVPGSVEAVKNLSKKCPLALVSGSNRKEILWALDELGIRNHFKCILGAEDYPKSKPSPLCYLKALELLNADPTSTLVFEDSNAGIASARAAGLWVVAVTCTNHYDQEISQAHAKVFDLTEVSWEWMQKLASGW